MNLLRSFDWFVISIYFVIVFGTAYWVTKKEKTGDSYVGNFLAGKNTGWFVIGASLFASNIGSEHIFGLAGTGAASAAVVVWEEATWQSQV